MMTNPTVNDDGISGGVVRRTLHFFWLVDESGSMGGPKIQSVNYAIKSVLPEIRKIEDSERVNIMMRVIKFGKGASWHIGPEPVPIKNFAWRDMDATGDSTCTAQAIQELIRELALEKIGQRNVPPVAILLSDGYCTEPSEDYNQAIAALDKMPWGARAVRIAIGIGGDYNKDQLDMFISPYLRSQGKIETLQARDARSLVEYITVSSTLAATASASSKSNSQDGNPMPVQINKAALEPDDGPTVGKFDALDPHAVF